MKFRLNFFDPDLNLNACMYAFYFDCLRIGTLEKNREQDCLMACHMIIGSMSESLPHVILYSDACSVSMIWNAIKDCGTSEHELYTAALSGVGLLRECSLKDVEILRDFYLAISMGSKE